MNRNLIRTILLLPALLTLLAGCASTPKAAKAKEAVMFEHPIDKVRAAAVDALAVTGFDIKKEEPNYVEGFRPRKVGLVVGSGGETVGVWLTELSRLDVHLEKTHFIESSLSDALPELKRQARLSGADAVIEIRERTSKVAETRVYHVSATGIRFPDSP
jgi:hypothetical protein